MHTGIFPLRPPSGKKSTFGVFTMVETSNMIKFLHLSQGASERSLCIFLIILNYQVEKNSFKWRNLLMVISNFTEPSQQKN